MSDWEHRYDKVETGWLLNNPDLIRVERNVLGTKLKGFVNKDGQEIIPCKYVSHRYYFQDDLLEVTDADNKVGFVNELGCEVIKCQYDSVSEIQDGLICVNQNTKEWNSKFRMNIDKEHWGLINTSGQVLIPLRYRFLGFIGPNRLIAQSYNNNRVGALDYKGNIVVPFDYYQLGKVTIDNRIEYSRGEGLEHGFMDLNGGIIQILPF